MTRSTYGIHPKIESNGNFRERIFTTLGILREIVLFFGNLGKFSIPVVLKQNMLFHSSMGIFWLHGKRLLANLR